MITSPQQMPWGGAFGTPGPDAGYALKLLTAAELPDRSPMLERVLAALMAARASLFGRAPIKEDLEVAMLLAGLSNESPNDLVERSQRWLEAAAHEPYPGRLAVAEVGPDLLRLKPDHLRRRLLSGNK
jgi:hypothetical protein